MNKISLGQPVDTQPKQRASLISGDFVGAVSKTLGTGKHAQDSIVWLTIKWSFSLGLFLSVALIIFMWPSHPSGTNPPLAVEFPTDQLKTIWSIFVPIVTLALGYMFGKGK
ncbi:hypothetical protein ACFX5Z_18610 [Aeromonas dhakensis]|uniref:hypothetical protein n=1 Tax=Aeromonas dhakensis TaxID=196024 RepID=UPI00370DD36A